MTERGIVISADSSSILGTPKRWKELWAEPLVTSGLEDRFVGMEVFPWFSVGWTRMLLDQAEGEGWPVASIHGRTGGVHEAYDWTGRLVMAGLNTILMDTPQLVRTFGSRVGRLVIHGPEARRGDLWSLLVREGNLVGEMDIENHLHVGADGTAVAVAMGLCDVGIKAGVVFDLVHDYQSFHYKPERTQRVDAVVRNLGWSLEQARHGYIRAVHLHVPLGINNDSLEPRVRTEMLREVAGVYSSRDYVSVEGTVGIENQQGVVDSVHLTAKRAVEQVDWNKRILEAVVESGL